VDRRLLPAAAGAMGAAWLAAAGVLYRPEGGSWPIGCPLKHLTGFDCPGCGSTRALGALTRLDLRAAVDHNALVPLAALFVAVSWVVWTWATWTGRPHRALVRGPAAVLTVGAVIVAFGLVRNLGVGEWLGSGLSPT
jgi:hypothetical protein